MTQGVKSDLPQKDCVQCLIKFQPRTNHQRYCSLSCKNKFIYWKEHKKRLEWNKQWYAGKKKQNPDFWKEKYQKTKASPTYRQRMNLSNRKGNKKLRQTVINHYGGSCECCKESNLEFLAIDHINGGGTKHRKQMTGKFNSIYRFLKSNKFPTGYRVLCHNCNSSIGFYGYCPHKKL